MSDCDAGFYSYQKFMLIPSSRIILYQEFKYHFNLYINELFVILYVLETNKMYFRIRSIHLLITSETLGLKYTRKRQHGMDTF